MAQAMRAVSRKDFLRLGGAGLVSAMLPGTAGCNGRQVKIVRFFTGTRETAALEGALTEIHVDRFEEQHPDIDLQREALPPDDIRREIQSRLRSREPPDVFAYDTGPGFGGVLADAGLLRPLENAYKEHGWDIYDWAKQQATYNGTVYGVPDQVEEIIVFYNKDLVPEVPHTVEELRQISDELKGRGKIPLAFGNREQYPASHMFSMGTSNVLDREGLDDILYGDGRWDTPEIEEAINLFFRDFVENAYYPKSPNALTYDGANALFYSGEAAMNPTGTWLVSEIVQAVQEFEVGFFPFPSIDYLLQDDTARLTIEKLNTIPAHPVDTEGLDVPELFEQVLDDLSEFPQAEASGYNIDVLAPQNFNEVMYTGFREVISGMRSPAEQAGALQLAWAEAKRAGKTPAQE
jgi:raffinose/stachyose/melibiose transport system substrate-binding protein